MNLSEMNFWTCNFIWNYFEKNQFILLSKMLRYYPTNISGDGYSNIFDFDIWILFFDILKGYYHWLYIYIYIYKTKIEG
jgi:hypothetical protein